MGIATFIEKLERTLSEGSKVLTGSSKADFQATLARWTDIDKREPGAVVLPATENDIVKIIRLAVESSVPFVAKAGGHSSWSTIGSSGLILDLSLIRTVEINTKNQTATAGAGTLIEDVVQAVDEKGYCVATGTVNSVGFIPSTVGGGITLLAPLVGFGSDNIVSARMVTAKGEIIAISDDENPELLYAIKGAGQYFGVITSLTVKIHPISILGTPDGTVWSGTLVFDLSKAAIQVKQNTTRSYCLAGVLPAPPTLDPIIMVAIIHLGSKADADIAFKPLLDLEPIAVPASSEVPFGKVNAAFQAFESKGGLKKWLAIGLTSMNQFKPDDMTLFVDQRAKVTEKYPTAKPTGFVIEFTSDGPWDKVAAEKETAWSHRDIATWCHLLCWASDEETLNYAYRVAERIKEHLRSTQEQNDYTIYGNFSRSAPVLERYKGHERVEKLRKLTLRWDPEGIFTREFL
ncbi:FAD-binding domain-containing protein [Hypoxylon trugodes]|uniref:FAD-binding domain-containing protein n=1 Tax=Hypoxylon trugodes TaxID=326681 RepID=UPI002191DEFD|nr:FAD-binding domain-containing protein [Hypoxylon trugodes]KAI1388176.1 FAD-binding domain-containing protein [Hypoxylon trugodes]